MHFPSLHIPIPALEITVGLLGISPLAPGEELLQPPEPLKSGCWKQKEQARKVRLGWEQAPNTAGRRICTVLGEIASFPIQFFFFDLRIGNVSSSLLFFLSLSLIYMYIYVVEKHNPQLLVWIWSDDIPLTWNSKAVIDTPVGHYHRLFPVCVLTVLVERLPNLTQSQWRETTLNYYYSCYSFYQNNKNNETTACLGQ